MNLIVFSREGEIRPTSVALVGLILSATAFAVAATLDMVSVSIAVPALLAMRPGPESAPEPVPGNVQGLRAEATVK